MEILHGLCDRILSHKAIKPLKKGLAQQLLNQLAKFALVIIIFLLPSDLFIEYTINHLFLEKAIYSSLFCAPSFLSRCSDPRATLAAGPVNLKTKTAGSGEVWDMGWKFY